MQLEIKKLHPEARLPTYGTEGAACFDLATIEAGVIEPGSSAVFRTGLAFGIPEGWMLAVYSRSGHGFKHGVRLVNGTGIIDSDYTGEMLVGLRNDGSLPISVRAGDRIAQAMLLPALRLNFREVDELKVTERAAKGFGSTGV